MLKGEQLNAVKQVLNNILVREQNAIKKKWLEKREGEGALTSGEELEKAAENLRQQILAFGDLCKKHDVKLGGNLSYCHNDAKSNNHNLYVYTPKQIKTSPEETAELQLVKAQIDLLAAKISFVKTFDEVEKLVKEAGFEMP